jgi:integrase
MRHTLMLPGIDAEMREFGEEGIRRGERELQAAPAGEIETLLTMLKLRDDWQGREMAWHLQWLLLKAETRRRRGYFGFDRAAHRSYIEIFTANIRNPNTRRAYARACSRFFAWCAYIEAPQQTHSPPGVKQQLAAMRTLFDWLITGQVVPINPASAVRGPKHVVKTGKAPVLDGKEWRKPFVTIPTDTVRDLRDRALIATLTYSFARINAALKMKVEDLRPQDAGWRLRPYEKGGKHHTMPWLHALAELGRLLHLHSVCHVRYPG